jgi:thiol-disulfide isomerase/thioredoxin
MNKKLFGDYSLTFLAGVLIATFCLSIGVLINGDYRILFFVNMFTFTLGGFSLKKSLTAVPLVVGIVLLSIPYGFYCSTQITITPGIIVFPIFNMVGIVTGYYFNTILSSISSHVRIAIYGLTICTLSCFMIPSVSTWVSIKESNKRIPLFEVVSLEGKKLHSSELHRKIVIVDFWATWCKPCIAEFKELEKLQNQVKNNQGVVVLVINEDDGGNTDVARKFLAKRSFNLPFYVDSMAMAYKAFEANAYPALYVIDKKSNIRLVKSGFNPSEDILQILLEKIQEIDN